MEPNTQQPDIFTRLGMVSASDEQKQQLVAQLGDLTMIRVISKLSDQLPESDLADVEALIDAGNGDAVEDKLRSLVPDFDQLVATTAQEAADQLVANQQAVLAQVRQQS